jgi:hypothetical protein
MSILPWRWPVFHRLAGRRRSRHRRFHSKPSYRRRRAAQLLRALSRCRAEVTLLPTEPRLRDGIDFDRNVLYGATVAEDVNGGLATPLARAD